MNKAFFDSVRASFGALTQGQVDGIKAIIEAFPAGTDRRHIAYALATAWHETATKMQPIGEYGGQEYFRRMYDPTGQRPSVAKALGNTQPGDGVKFHGRGLVQLTGRANYDRAGKTLGVDLIANPDLAKRPDIAAQIMVRGMTEGWFTGKRLSDYFNASTSDPVNARRIINGTDKAELIAGYYRKFLAALDVGAAAEPVVVVSDEPPVVIIEAPPSSTADMGKGAAIGAAIAAAVAAILKSYGVI